ncbi:MAG: LicD family protein [Bacilli bacterium]|nr:LicD family protein [Bacilli bacterium]
MLRLTTKELQKLQGIELEVLIEFDRICKKHNLKYVLVGGSLLGAIRHNGFIPWDDDIDVSMLRDDYNKFIKIQKDELNNDKYYFQSMETDDKFGLPFAKLRRKNSIYCERSCPIEKKQQGIWLDIFPIDKISENYFCAILDFIRVFYYKNIIAFKLNFKFYSTGIKKFILYVIKFLSKFYNLEKTKKKYYATIEKHNKKDSKKVINHGGVYLLREIADEKIFTDIVTHKFEGHYFNIPKDYDEYLTRIYGDYMKLPKKKKRVSHHLIDKITFPPDDE